MDRLCQGAQRAGKAMVETEDSDGESARGRAERGRPGEAAA